MEIGKVFSAEMSKAEARHLYSAEMAHAAGLQLRQGIKQKADTLMLETPMKNAYRVAADNS